MTQDSLSVCLSVCPGGLPSTRPYTITSQVGLVCTHIYMHAIFLFVFPIIEAQPSSMDVATVLKTPQEAQPSSMAVATVLKTPQFIQTQLSPPYIYIYIYIYRILLTLTCMCHMYA